MAVYTEQQFFSSQIALLMTATFLAIAKRVNTAAFSLPEAGNEAKKLTEGPGRQEEAAQERMQKTSKSQAKQMFRRMIVKNCLAKFTLSCNLIGVYSLLSVCGAYK